jgi:hypothetical protein
VDEFAKTGNVRAQLGSSLNSDDRETRETSLGSVCFSSEKGKSECEKQEVVTTLILIIHLTSTSFLLGQHPYLRSPLHDALRGHHEAEYLVLFIGERTSASRYSSPSVSNPNPVVRLGMRLVVKTWRPTAQHFARIRIPKTSSISYMIFTDCACWSLCTSPGLSTSKVA